MKHVAIFLVFTVLLATLAHVYALQTSAREDAHLLEGIEDLKLNKIKVFNGTVTSITNTSIAVRSGEFSGELIAVGKWLLVARSDVGVYHWAKTMEYVREGDSVIVMASLSKGNETINLLLGLRQGDTFLARLALVKYSKHEWKHGTFEFSCKLVEKRGYSLIIEKKEFKALVAINPNGKWYRAGQGEVLWKDVINEFNPGDMLWLCTHNILVFKTGFAEIFGINAIIWGFSGAIIDLDAGIALAKYPL